ncbi:MAG: hypothetical protein V1746_05675 [bacterium]
MKFLTERFHRQFTSLYNAFQCANGYGFIAMHSNDDLPTVIMSPLLMTTALSDFGKSVLG